MVCFIVCLGKRVIEIPQTRSSTCLSKSQILNYYDMKFWKTEQVRFFRGAKSVGFSIFFENTVSYIWCVYFLYRLYRVHPIRRKNENN